MEMEQFLSLRLLPHHQIEDYFSKIMDKDRRLGKKSQEILLTFIEGLPSQLAFLFEPETPRTFRPHWRWKIEVSRYPFRPTTPHQTFLSLSKRSEDHFP